MKLKLFSLILVFTLVCAIGFARTSNHPDKGKKYPSFYKEGIVVNGSSPEWENSLFNFNKQSQVNYAIVNDTSAFYICLRIADEGEQMKVLHNGIDISFNSKGKKKAAATLHFPIGGKADIGVKLDPGDRRSSKMMHLMYLLQMQDMELNGFKNSVNGFQGIKTGKNGVLAAVNWDSTNIMVYEARIPFTAFTEDVHAVEPLAVGIIVKGAPKPRSDQGGGMQNTGQTGMPGGQGQGRQGGMNPGGMGREGQMSGGYGGNQKIYEDDEIWQLIVVAKKE